MSEVHYMHMTPDTIRVLKSFAGIQPNIVFMGGNTVRTISESGSILASAKVPDTFPDLRIGIFDLSEFLNALSMLKEPVLNITEGLEYISITGQYQQIKYYLSDPSMLTHPDTPINPASPDASFTITREEHRMIRRASSILSAPDVIIRGQEGSKILKVDVTDSENPSANRYSLSVPPDRCTKAEGSAFDLMIKADNMGKVIEGEYKVSIHSNSYVHFEYMEEDLDIEYWVGLYKDSVFTP